MRITQNNLTQLSINMNKLPPEIKAQLGKVVSGQITSILGDKVATLVSGSTELTVQISGLKLSENQMITLQITGYEEGAFTAKILPESVNSDQKATLSNGLVLDKLGLPQTEENKQILTAMLKANLPIDLDTFSRMRQGLLELKIVSGELKQSDAPLLSRNDLELPMKALAIKLIQIAHEPMAAKDMLTPLDKQPMLDQVHANAQDAVGTKGLFVGVSQGVISSNETLIPPSQAQTPIPLDVEGLLGKIIFSPENTETIKEPILNLFNQFSHFDESLLIKHDLPLTIKNMFLSLMGAFQSEKNVERFIRVIDRKSVV